MTVSFYIRLAEGTLISLRKVQVALRELDEEHKLFVLLGSSLHPSIADFLINDLHEGVSASAFDGLKGSRELLPDCRALEKDEEVHFYRKGSSCFFVSLLFDEPNRVAVRLKYGSSPPDSELALDMVKVVMNLAGVSQFTCEESGDDTFRVEDIPIKFGDAWKAKVAELMSTYFMKRPKPGDIVTLVSPRRTFYLGHHSWVKLHEEAGGEAATPSSFMMALHKAMRALQAFDAESEGYYQNMGIFIRKPQGTVSVGSWAPSIAYFMRPFTYISFTGPNGEHISFHYRDLPVVAGKFAILLDELHILLQRVPNEAIDTIMANARTVETEI